MVYLTYTLYARLPLHMYLPIGPMMLCITTPLGIPGAMSYLQYLRLPGLHSSSHVLRILTHSMGYVYSSIGYYTLVPKDVPAYLSSWYTRCC